MARDGVLQFPVIAVNDSDTSICSTTAMGRGATLDGILRATNLLVAGSTVIVAGSAGRTRLCACGPAARAPT